MTKLLKPFISWWRLYQKTRSAHLAYRILPEVYTPAFDSPVTKKNGKIMFERYNKHFSKMQLALFDNHGELLLKYIKSSEVFFTDTNGNTETILVNFNGKNIYLSARNYDNLKVIEEVFIEKVYDFNANEKYVVCDVGMNVAAASLYFASFDNIEKVYGYEPFPSTYLIAKANLEMNLVLSEKIEAFNFGLGNRNELIDVPLPGIGSLGGSTDLSFIQKTDKGSDKVVNVEIRNVISVLRDIKETHPGTKIILKLDCEGAEYDIMEEIESNEMIHDISIYMIEFHFKGNKILKEIFYKNDFLTLSPSNEDISQYGMLYAVKV